MKFLKFFLLLWVIFAFLDPDPDSESGSTDPDESGSNEDPDPDPQPWLKVRGGDHRLVAADRSADESTLNLDESTLNLDITAMIAYVSALTNGRRDFIFKVNSGQRV